MAVATEPVVGPEPAAGAEPAAVRVTELTRTFGTGPAAVRALRGVSLSVRPGEMLAVCGRSGSGKTTLLHVIAGLDRATSGQVWVAGQEVTAMSRDELLRLRREKVALVFQSYALLPTLSAAENVGIPMRLARVDPGRREERTRALLDMVGLADRAGQRPLELSGGEQQRVAIARALAGNAQVLLADEPTGQLDSQTGHQVMALLRGITHDQGITTIVATHDRTLISAADRVLTLQDGLLAA
jgi:putative ABC transport system ATP-binding protein